MCKHISKYLMKKKILCEQQCGFINGLSADISVAEIIKQIHDGLDVNKFGVCFFLDLRKAFDMVSMDILLS